jgi:hypothetical protein
MRLAVMISSSRTDLIVPAGTVAVSKKRGKEFPCPFQINAKFVTV